MTAQPTTYILSVPPGVNHLYFNIRGRGRGKTKVYRNWIRGELNALLAQRARLFEPRASISITLPEARKGDADNKIKPCLDLLVRAGVLKDDGPQYVGALSISFSEEKSVLHMHVTLTAMK